MRLPCHPDRFEQNLKKILEGLEASTEAFVVIGDLPDLTRLPRFIDQPSPAVTAARVAAFNATIERQATRFGAPIARLSKLDMLNDLTADLDGFNPNNQGHLKIAIKFLEVIIPGLDLE